MKNLITTTAFFLIILSSVLGQDDKIFREAKSYYEKGMEQAQAGKLEQAIKLFDKSIEIKSDEYISWYNRGIAKSMLGYYEEALTDFEQTVKIVPEYQKGYLNLGNTKKHLTDYAGAISDYNTAIRLDSNYSDAYYNRGLIYEMLSKKDSACFDFNKAKEFGSKNAQKKVNKCSDTTETSIPTYSILRLTKTSFNEKYGFTQENPVKVGTGPEGGPANQRAYLNLLRDGQGKPIKAKRLSSCCPYQSDNSLMGMAMLDQYEIIYLNEKGKKKKASVFISFYDYEEPQILFGFKTVRQ
jgi:tetratricopeptide (TPR) repeat protein